MPKGRPRKYGPCLRYGNHKVVRGACPCGFSPTGVVHRAYIRHEPDSMMKRRSGLWCWDCLQVSPGGVGGTLLRCPKCAEKHRQRDREGRRLRVQEQRTCRESSVAEKLRLSALLDQLAARLTASTITR